MEWMKPQSEEKLNSLDSLPYQPLRCGPIAGFGGIDWLRKHQFHQFPCALMSYGRMPDQEQPGLFGSQFFGYWRLIVLFARPGGKRNWLIAANSGDET